jgi:hypothetical protein
MSRQRLAMLLIGALLAISAAMYLSSQRNTSRDTSGGALLPSLAAELNTVSQLNVVKGSATPTVTLNRQGDQWTVAQRADYPADISKLRKLLLALSEAKIREQKTSDPANFAAIGLEDPALPGAAGAQVELTAKDGRHSVIVGKPIGEGNFVRRGGENLSYIVEPGISFEAQPKFWIDNRLLDLAAASIQNIEVKPAAGAAYSVHKTADASPTGASYTLTGIPSGRAAADSRILAPSPTTFSNLTADDVAAAGSLDLSMPSVVILTLSDGDIITLTGIQAGEKRWIEVAATKDAALGAKTAGRAFEISGYRYNAIFRPLEQLLVPKPGPADAKSAPHGILPPGQLPPPKKLPARAP